MKIILSKADLTTAISKVQSVVALRPVAPILGTILMEAKEDELILTATDLMVSIRVFIGAKVLEEGGITIPARKFFQLIRELTAPQIEIHSMGPDVVFINAGASHFKIPGMLPSEFPPFPDLSTGLILNLSGASLKSTLMRTQFAAAREDARIYLNGVCMELEGEHLTCIGSDGKRLAKVHIAAPLPAKHKSISLIPIKAVEEMLRLLPNETVELTLMPDKLALRTPSSLLMTKLLSGKFPDYSRFIPQTKGEGIALHREELQILLRQIILFTSDEDGAARFLFSAGELSMEVEHGELGAGKVKMAANYTGEKLEIAFNIRYFLEALAHSTDEIVYLHITHPFEPGLLTDSTTAQFVLMPMRITAPAVATPNIA